MGSIHVPADMRRLVIQRAMQRCEYCLIPELATFIPHEVDHVVALKHGGKTEPSNLAFSCGICNRHKGSDLTSIDPATGLIVTLFNPRQDRWAEHFHLNEGKIQAPSAIGRVTARLLQLNTAYRIAEGKALQISGSMSP